MCGLNGFNWNDVGRLRQMMATIKHRGPDDAGVELTSAWSLGHNRLAIIDLSSNGHQPMVTPDGRWVIIFNGEVYNFLEIKQELRELGYQFKSQTDTEVILSAYVQWQERCLQKFNGMFALAILDTATQELFLARDRVGIKPLYYYAAGGKFIFASEIKAILDHPEVPRDLDLDSLNSIFRVLYVPAPKTIWQHIQQLAPGHYLEVSAAGSLQLTRYWQIPEQSLLTDRADILTKTKNLLTESVRLQLVADRPVGIFLSGGLDSTIITGLASALSSHQVQTFSVGYEVTEEATKYNSDYLLARQTAAYFGTKHHEYIISAQDVAANLETAIYHMDEPIANHIQAVNLLLAKKVSAVATVVLGGDGGDELFGGYERYYYNFLIDQFRSFPSFFCQPQLVKNFLKFLGRPSVYDLLQLPPGVDRYLHFFAQKEKMVSSFLKPEFNRPEATRALFQSLYFDRINSDFTRQVMRTDISSWLPSESLMRSDKMSMAASIGQRVPFLDHRLVELADRIPVSYKLGRKGLKVFAVGRHYQGKTVLREALAEFIPDHVRSAPKWGWFSPMAKWLRGPLLSLVREVFSPGYNRDTAAMFDFKVLNQLLERHLRKEQYALSEIWAVVTFQLWFRKFVEKQ